MKNLNTIYCFLIDDDPEEIDIFKLALEELDITVHCTAFTDCNKAIKQLTEGGSTPDCIFLDLYMGNVSGKECLNKIVSTEIISRIPVVILSGSKNEAQIYELLKMGAQEFMIKALSIDKLKDQLHDYFTTHFNLSNDATI